MTTTQILLDTLKQHQHAINLATTDEKNKALEAMAVALEHAEHDILQANAVDLDNAKGQISEVMLDRLRLTSARIRDMAKGIRALIDLKDPVGVTLEMNTLPNGLIIEKRAVPFGVIGMIYESRPNVTSDAAALAIKSGNAIILRGGKEAFHSSNAIVTALKKGLQDIGFNTNVIALVQDTTRTSATELMTAKGKLDLLIPRGGAGLIQAVIENAKVPVIETGTGICHIYIDRDADKQKALTIVENAKTSRPSVCNAAEILLIHEAIAADFLPLLDKQIGERVQFRVDETAISYLQRAKVATDSDFDTEFLDYILAVKIVKDVSEAITHIKQHSTQHSDAIVTENKQTATYFTAHVDSAAVYVNASTRFTDGGEFGLGCELGISTQKMHARGPMGLREMITYKYIITGDGHIR